MYVLAASQGSSSVLAMTSLVISLFALGFTAYQSYATHKRDRTNLVPFLQSDIQRRPFSEKGLTTIEWRLVNHGLGPARIKSYELFLDEQPVNTGKLSDIVMTLVKAFGTLPISPNVAHRCGGDLVPKDASIDVLKVALPTPPLKMKELKDLDDLSGIESAFGRFHLVVTYESLYGQPFTYDSRNKGSDI